MEKAEQRQELLRNLAQHARAARGRLCLNSVDVARLMRIEESVIVGIEHGVDSNLSIEAAIGLARGLGLTDQGLPRPKPFGTT